MRALEGVSAIVKPETVLGWYRDLVAKKLDGSAQRKKVGRPRTGHEIEKLMARMVDENPTWGYDRIVGALGNLGYSITDTTVGRILKTHGIPLLCRSQVAAGGEIGGQGWRRGGLKVLGAENAQ